MKPTGEEELAVFVKDVTLTPEERRVLNCLILAWNQFIQLPEQHPHDVSEFNLAIHSCQYLIAIRSARRLDPDVWFSKDGPRTTPEEIQQLISEMFPRKEEEDLTNCNCAGGSAGRVNLFNCPVHKEK